MGYHQDVWKHLQKTNRRHIWTAFATNFAGPGTLYLIIAAKASVQWRAPGSWQVQWFFIIQFICWQADKWFAMRCQRSMVCLVGFQCRSRLNISIISEHDSLLCCLGKPSCTQVPTTLTLLECCWRRRSNIMCNTISGKAFNFCGKWIWFEWCMR